MSLRWPWARPAFRVGFLIAGVQKGGTTALEAYLRDHPQVCLGDRKELHFFDDEARFAQPRADYADYHAHFQPGRGHRIVGEATPIYLYWAAAPARIHAYNPAMRLIVALRNPIERAYSHWNMERDRGAESLPFGAALRAESERAAAARPLQDRVHSYVDRGFYTAQLQRLWQLFPREQTLVLRQEDLRARPAEALARVTAFLGVDPLPAVAPREVHARPYVAPMERADWEFLRATFEPEIRSLEHLLGWDCRAWLNPPRS